MFIPKKYFEILKIFYFDNILKCAHFVNTSDNFYFTSDKAFLTLSSSQVKNYYNLGKNPFIVTWTFVWTFDNFLNIKNAELKRFSNIYVPLKSLSLAAVDKMWNLDKHVHVPLKTESWKSALRLLGEGTLVVLGMERIWREHVFILKFACQVQKYTYMSTTSATCHHVPSNSTTFCAIICHHMPLYPMLLV